MSKCFASIELAFFDYFADKQNANPTVYAATAAHHSYNLNDDLDDDGEDLMYPTTSGSNAGSRSDSAAPPSARGKRDVIDSLEIFGA